MPKASSLALSVRGLSKRYANGRQALENVNLSIPEGSFYALLGANGAGKSTFLNILADIVHPSEGRILFFGDDLFAHRKQCKKALGVVPQEAAFDPFFTVQEVLAFSAGMYGVKLEQAWYQRLLESLALKEHEHRCTRALSGGMRRRLLIAQALVHRPRLVVLDEPTAGVDISLRQRLWAFMKELNQEGVSILLTTHYLEEAQQLCDTVAIIDHGRVQCEQSMQSLMQEATAQRLSLFYAQPLDVALLNDAQWQVYRPVYDAQQRCLHLSLSHDAAFDTAYHLATQCFASPSRVQLEHERLEDVFMRLTTVKSR